MLRLIACFLYMGGYLVYTIPRLSRLKRLPEDLKPDIKKQLIHDTPKKWAKTFMTLTGSQVEVEGLHHIPEGPVLFASNHEGNFDIPVLIGAIEKPFGFISKIEVKKVPVLSSWMEAIDCVFIDRKNRDKAAGSIMSGVELLKKGNSLVIFPEGTRSKGGPVGLFKAGGFRLAKDSGVPIVPISILGTADVFEKNGRLVKPAKIKVTISPPVYSRQYKDKELISLAEEIRDTILQSRNEKRIAS
ncbi:lysophospholipid acyltransferase family protein [Mesobacillus selenatarsenatis]|uniref:1-acyl-sn-glycerol-3-phosphate acyltransferase n=1 Tax=Mesobacillus selenatarsenatis (strain DSM 18680 / JCM 14380 / FERM P-15431 / SF-1) TaxID=1321606 RepID=A0A0A8X5S8_MESS1|nr:lysophospholipid acyltransferase family protein [Mesobacillus selenatarsenatis]GAM15288.1 1-acyl-sn-glycerol-3-phosphate acyltransferase [Mesobacillus selenatarsenatis SF-1]